jgi:hypothetical protein
MNFLKIEFKFLKQDREGLKWFKDQVNLEDRNILNSKVKHIAERLNIQFYSIAINIRYK